MAKETTKMVLQSMITLSSAALGLVAALAWNDAIKETIKRLLGGDESLASKYTYAVFCYVDRGCCCSRVSTGCCEGWW